MFKILVCIDRYIVCNTLLKEEIGDYVNCCSWILLFYVANVHVDHVDVIKNF